MPFNESSRGEHEREQEHLDLLYQTVDSQRADVSRRLSDAMCDDGSTAQARIERDAMIRNLAGVLANCDAAEHGLCFGRLDVRDGSQFYVGRIGLRSADSDADPLLIDWRAPVASRFYTATAAHPQGVSRRRHLHTRGRRLIRLDDQLLDGPTAQPSDQLALAGEAALLAALQAERTGRMRDVVATLQEEQDRIIRAPHHGVLVVQGGPGTGKTAVALHRAAFLLYTYPFLHQRGVLVVGPNSAFLSYISEVLPGLGETNVLLSTVDQLFSGVSVTAVDDDTVAEVKGRLVMAEVLASAVRAHEVRVDTPIQLSVGGEQLTLEPELLNGALEYAQASRLPHNRARDLFSRCIIDLLALRLAGVVVTLEEQIDADLAEFIDLAEVEKDIADDLLSIFGKDAPPVDLKTESRAQTAAAAANWLEVLPHDPLVRGLLDRLWPALTPQQLLQELFAEPGLLAGAAPCLSLGERDLLRRAPGHGWTLSDIPLLDEAAELLGDERPHGPQPGERERRMRVEYAQGVLDIARGSRPPEDEELDQAETLSAPDLIASEHLADWFHEAGSRTMTERAAVDRKWVFGHIIVDEAQELSPMAWRLLVRRCPTRSFTVVGDIAQTSSAAGSRTWQEVLEPFFGARWQLTQLTVNYRTPAEVMAASDRVLEAIHPDLERARAVRSNGILPRCERVHPARFLGRLVELVAEEADGVRDGRLAVITAAPDLERLARAITMVVPDADWGASPDLEQRVVVLTAGKAKGLEFDTVVVANPQALLMASRRGINDLYVSLTRACQRLVVLVPGNVPSVLSHLVKPP